MTRTALLCNTPHSSATHRTSTMLTQAAAGEEPEAIASEARCSVIFASHTDWVTGLAVAAGRIMASSSNDGTIKLWDLAATAGTATRDTDSVTVTRRTPGRAGRSIGVEEEMEGESGEDEGGGSVGGRGRSSAKESCSIGTENGGTATKRIRKAGLCFRTAQLLPRCATRLQTTEW